jgi:hypothetical protein
MRQILQTSSLSFAESALIALEAQEISAVISNPSSAGLPPASITVSIMEDGEYERARSIVNSLQPSAPAPGQRYRSPILLAILLLVSLVVLLCLNI